MRVLVTMPRHDNRVYMEAAGGFFRSTLADGVFHDVQAMSPGMSLLTTCFNACWARGLNLWRAGELDRFAMMHADVGPERGWVDTLEAERQRAGADVIAAVIPIKDDRGLVSTAVDDTGDPYRVRRLTMREVLQLPPTFTADDVGGPLLLNTGLWLAALGPWAEQVLFRQTDRLRVEAGQYVARCISEDWDFSMQLNALGLKLAATRAVAVKHLGESHWSNQHDWGRWDTDEDNGTGPAAQRARARRRPPQEAVARP